MTTAPESTTCEAASIVRYIGEDGTVIDETAATKTPRQSDWVYIEGDGYKVYDVVHTAYPDVGRMVTTVFVWWPDPYATSDHLSEMYEMAIDARNGGMEDGARDSSSCVGNALELTHEGRTMATVTASIPPMCYEGVCIAGTDDQFSVMDTTCFVADGRQVTEAYLTRIDEKARGAMMASVRRTLQGQLKQARNRILEQEGPDAYEKLMNRIEARAE